MLEATTLPTAPQPQPSFCLYSFIFRLRTTRHDADLQERGGRRLIGETGLLKHVEF